MITLLILGLQNLGPNHKYDALFLGHQFNYNKSPKLKESLSDA